MKKCWLVLAMMGSLLGTTSGHAGLFDQGIGSAMYYGPYTGGHAYSYNVAYGYGLAFSPADSWRRDPFAYPAGVYPYRPDGQPIYYRVFPNTGVPYVSVPGPDGLPVLVPATTADPGKSGVPMLASGLAPELQPVPGPAAEMRPATIRISVPDGAEVWFDKEKMTQAGPERIFRSPPLLPGKTLIYSVRARWNDGGREVEQFRVVGVRAGETAKLSFPAVRP